MVNIEDTHNLFSSAAPPWQRHHPPAEETEANIIAVLEECRDELEVEDARAEAEAEAAAAENEATATEEAEPVLPLSSANNPMSEYVAAYVDTLEAAGSVRRFAISDYLPSCRHITTELVTWPFAIWSPP